MPAIRVRNLRKQFSVAVKKPGLWGAFASFFHRETKLVDAVRDVSFDIGRGELVGFLGPNGAGKTTTLKILSGLLYPSGGTVDVIGHVPWKRETPFQKKFSIVMGNRTQLWWDLPARETFALNQKIYEIPDKEFRAMRDELVETLELAEIIQVPVKKLSLGERMKSELACALLHRPEVLLLDEPTLGLDVLMQKKLRQFIKSYNKRYQATILLTSHNMTDVEELCDRVMVINDGQLLYDGSLDRIVERYAPDKIVSLTASRALDAKDLGAYGRVVSVDGTSAKIEVPRRDIPAIMGRLLAQVPVVDLNIEELPIEEIVRQVFSKAPSVSGDGVKPAETEEAADKKRAGPSAAYLQET